MSRAPTDAGEFRDLPFVDDDSFLEENPFPQADVEEVDIEFAPELSSVAPASRGWLIDAADLLAEPDPGPTPYLVEGLIVDQAIVAVVGRWKTTKSYGLLEICIAIATGRPAFRKLAVTNPGPVVFINEESGKAALWRRLDALCRGSAIDPEDLRGRLHLAANERIKLDDLAWQKDLIEMGEDLRPRLICFDPLARMKAPGRKESDQSDMAVAVEFMRELREKTGSAVAFVQHRGHQGDHMRGSSDLESVWETRLAWKREGQSSLVTVESEHREAESAGDIRYRIVWDGETRTMRFDLDLDTLETAVADYLRSHPDASANEVDANVDGTRTKVLAIVKKLREQGGSDLAEPLPNHPGAGTPVGGSADPPFRGAGTTLRVPGSDAAEPPIDEEEIERLFRDHSDIAGGAS